MSNSIFGIVVSAAGANPVVTGSRKKTMHNWINLLSGMASGTRTGSGVGYAKVNTASATGTFIPASMQAGDTVTVNGVALTAEQERATGTVTCASAAAADTVTVNGVVFTGVNRAAVLGVAEFDIRTSDTLTNASLAAQINGYATGTAIPGLITATATATVVTLRAVAIGTAANAYTLASSNNTRLAVSNTTLLGGLARSNNKFDVSPGATNTQVAAEIALCITSSSTSLVSGQVSATSLGATVTVTSLWPGLPGNAMTIANSARAPASGARLTGGTTTQFTF